MEYVIGLKEILHNIIGSVEIEPLDSLKEKGVTSLNLMTLIAQIENVFDVEIPEEELVLSNFESLDKIVKLIESLKE